MKNILILSTEPWGKILLSKMHYAIHLAKMGNKVYFVNPPRNLPGKKLVTIQAPIPNFQKGITIIDTRTIKGSLFFRYKWRYIYKKISLRYIKEIKKYIGSSIDEVWCFDPHQYADLTKFRARTAILFLYDFYKGKNVFHVAETADAIISISQLILNHYANIRKPNLLIEHGLGYHFAKIAGNRVGLKNFKIQEAPKIKIGYVGNLLREGISMDIAQDIISQHLDIEFHFWGPDSMHENNVSDSSSSISQQLLNFIVYLRNQQNVFLHGVTEQENLAQQINKMDGFIFLYSPDKDVNKASNSHKIIEYLSTGKVIISTYVSNYEKSNLLVMNRNNNENKFVELFNEVVGNLLFYNSIDKQQERIAFALDNTYVRQIQKIQKFISLYN